MANTELPRRRANLVARVLILVAALVAAVLLVTGTATASSGGTPTLTQSICDFLPFWPGCRRG